MRKKKELTEAEKRDLAMKYEVAEELGLLEKVERCGWRAVSYTHLDVYKRQGPEGGDGGGTIVAVGTPEEICRVSASYTGQYLKPLLDAKVETSRNTDFE